MSHIVRQLRPGPLQTHRVSAHLLDHRQRRRQARTHWTQDRFTETSVEIGRGTDRQGEREGGGGGERTAGEDALDTGQAH